MTLALIAEWLWLGLDLGSRHWRCLRSAQTRKGEDDAAIFGRDEHFKARSVETVLNHCFYNPGADQSIRICLGFLWISQIIHIVLFVFVGTVHALLCSHGDAFGGDEVVVSGRLFFVVAMSLRDGQTLGDEDLANVCSLPDRDGAKLTVLRDFAHGNLALIVDGYVDLLANGELAQSITTLVGVRVVGLAKLVIPSARSAN